MKIRGINKLIQNYLQDKLILRRLTLIFLDLLSINFAILLSFLNQNKTNLTELNLNIFSSLLPAFILSSLLFITTFYCTGQYKGLTKYTGSTTCYKLAFKEILFHK